MKQAGRATPLHYSIKNIIASILSDNPRARKYSDAKKINKYNALAKKAQRYPGLPSLLTPSHIRAYPISGAGFFARIGLLPPDLVIVDERFKQMCCLPYWTVYTGSGGGYKRFGRCPGYDWLPGCPPQSPPVQAVQQKINEADIFIVLQTQLLENRWGVEWKFAVLHRLAAEIEKSLGGGSVIERYGSGPCNACSAQLCLHSKPCAAPGLKTVSLESMGICVERMCTDLSLLTGNPRWNLTWLRHFGQPRQQPKKWKYVEALAVKLP